MNIRRLLPALLAALMLAAPALADDLDCPYFNQLPNYDRAGDENREFAAYRFFTGRDSQPVEGRLWRVRYNAAAGVAPASELQIIRNYANALRELGGTIVYEGPSSGEHAGAAVIVGRAVCGNSELWVEAQPFNNGADYWLTVVERGVMRQAVRAGDEWRERIAAQGYINVYIIFEVSKAEIRPEYRNVIDTIAAMLANDTTLELSIEGHTDNTGDSAANLVLSLNRAKAVWQALIDRGIDFRRLTYFGWGQDKPIADNRTAQGLILNRRVELVKRR